MEEVTWAWLSAWGEDRVRTTLLWVLFWAMPNRVALGLFSLQAAADHQQSGVTLRPAVLTHTCCAVLHWVSKETYKALVAVGYKDG